MTRPSQRKARWETDEQLGLFGMFSLVSCKNDWKATIFLVHLCSGEMNFAI